MKILSVENLSRSFGGIKANDNISFNVDEGSILGIIGPNGAGKSTLFDLITGYTKADSGKVEFFEKNIFGLSPDKISNLGVGRTFQKLKPFADQTLLENVMIGAFVKERI
jgi:branched-chain amino acid transport system ATP-binding protein